eukprot:SAG11_NODE_17006_length_531_cov_0.951389_1_plen_150_part_10
MVPELDGRLAEQEKANGVSIPASIRPAVLQIACDQAEAAVRKEVHVRVGKAFVKANQGLIKKGCGVLEEAGEEQPEDEYGFLTADGGYSAWKKAHSDAASLSSLASAMGVPDPREMVKKVVDKQMVQTLNAEAEASLSGKLSLYQTEAAA